MWMARSNVLAFSVAENCDANLCSVHRWDASERAQRETNTGKHLFFFLLKHTQATCHLRDGNSHFFLRTSCWIKQLCLLNSFNGNKRLYVFFMM